MRTKPDWCGETFQRTARVVDVCPDVGCLDVDCGLTDISEPCGYRLSGDETGYTPGRPVDKITVEDILSALRGGTGSELATSEDPSRAVVREQYEKVVLAEMHAAGAVTLQNLVMRVASLPQVVKAVDEEKQTEPARAAVG